MHVCIGSLAPIEYDWSGRTWDMTVISKWQKGVLEWFDADTVNLSVVFTWDADDAYQRAVFWREAGKRVRIGGPGVFRGAKDLREVAEVGGDIPDVVRRHNPDATFASRGCPVGCWFCIVPAMEGRTFTEIDDFEPRPILCDNNLSALSPEFQDHIVARYQATNVPLMDAQSGFEPATFDEDVFERWRQINRGPWRFAFDETGERDDVRCVCRMLRRAGINQKRIRVYVLIGNEPVEECLARVLDVLNWGGEPHCQPIIKLNARRKEPWVKHDWTRQRLTDMARWANRRLWKYTSFGDYDRGRRTARTDQTPAGQMTMAWQ